jgi:hypothetical protein
MSIENFPFVLSLSKHESDFFISLMELGWVLFLNQTFAGSQGASASCLDRFSLIADG